MRSRVTALATRGTRHWARNSADGQAVGAQRTTLALLAAARIATLATIGLLVFLSPAPQTAILLPLLAFSAVFTTGSSRWLWRTAEVPPWTINVIVAVDLIVWLSACAASGGSRSAALMLYVVFPSIGALVMTTPALWTAVAAVAAVRPLLGGGADALVAFYGVGLWAVAVGIAASRGRRVFVRRLTGLDAVWSALARGPSEAVRERVADELRHTALDPVRAIRTRIATARATPETSSVLGTELRTIIQRIRGIAYELYAPPDLHGGGVEASLRHLAHRRSASAEVDVTLDGDVEMMTTTDRSMTLRARIYGVAAPDPAQRRIHGVTFREVRGYIVTARAGLIPVIVGVPLLIGGTSPGYFWLASLTSVHLAASAALFWRPRRDRWYSLALAIDAALLAACFLTVGSARPDVLPLALLLPVANSSIFPWTLCAPIALGTAIVLATTGPSPQPALTVGLLWGAAIAMAAIDARTVGAERLFAAAEHRNRLLQGLLETEDLERRRLAERLHDDVLQLLFVARQDLMEVGDGCPGALDRAQATLGVVLDRLTQTVSDLDVGEGAAAVTGGLLQALAATAAERDGPAASVHVDLRAAGVHDGLLVQFARELYANAVRHSRASTVCLSVSRKLEQIVLDVTDDGVGFDFRLVDGAVARGCLGLATLRDRTAWSGGTVELGASAHGGARVQVALPLADA